MKSAKRPVRRFIRRERDLGEDASAHDLFRFAVESCPWGMVVYGPDNRIVLVNGESERLFGYPRNELIGRRADALMPDGFARDLVGLRKDGSTFPAEVHLNHSYGDGALTVGLIVDMSERRKADHLKDEFVSTVSHELRTPLTSIAGSLGLIAGGAAGALPERAMKLLRIAHKNSERLVRLINDILDIEKIESGKVVLDLKRVELCALVEQAIDANRGYAESYGVRVDIDPASATAFVRADTDRLVQVITNLLSNACKFSPRDGEVTVAISPSEEQVRLTVRDHGPGIPEEFKPRIFERFAQADAADARQKGGAGLGLSIVRQIVALLGGSVGFADAPGGGTEFHVNLPRWTCADGQNVSPNDGQALRGASRSHNAQANGGRPSARWPD